MITREKIKIFDSYGGNIDELANAGPDHKKNLFDNNDWSLIEIFYQNIELINNTHVDQTCIDQTLIKLKEHCDHDSFDMFTSKIEYYNDFKKVADILRQIKELTSYETNTAWAGFDSAAIFLEELSQDIEHIETCNFQTLEKVKVEFLPTCSYQELSISNGWGDRYVKLSGEFDKLYEKLTERKSEQNSNFPKVRQTWYQKLFDPNNDNS